MSYIKEFKIDTNNATGDPFGRVRMSQPKGLIESKMTNDNMPLFWDDQEMSGSGTGSTYTASRASVDMTVSASTAGKRTRQTFQRFNYQTGKGHLILCTGIMEKTGGGAGILRRIGYFTEKNGLFFQDNAGTKQVVVRSFVSGVAVDTEINQSSWNVDKMDGTGDSGITIDWSKANIFVIDFEWLGVGRVRFGFNIDGVTYVCHQVLNANNIESVYMTSPNLPLRYEIENTGTGVASSMEQICCSVSTEGDIEPNGVIRYASTGGTHVDANTTGTTYALIGIRLKSGYLDRVIELISQDILIITSSEFIEWILLMNPTVAGTFSYVDETNSAVQIARGSGSGNTVTGGIPIAGGFLTSAVKGGADTVGLENALKLGVDLNGVTDQIVLCAKPIQGSSNVDVEGSLTWRELS